eukprot:FR742827.1.p1 GENE.FR742827.1~~FR742827.1.p1  ORF type:complete len:163 (+),score=7.60 FR742827.1:112-600(+)
MGALLLLLFMAQVAVLDTGIDDSHSLMKLDVPPSLILFTAVVGVMTLVMMYFQASKAYMHDLTIALVLIGVFMTCCGIAYGILGFGLPLRAVIEDLPLEPNYPLENRGGVDPDSEASQPERGPDVGVGSLGSDSQYTRAVLPQLIGSDVVKSGWESRDVMAD